MFDRLANGWELAKDSLGVLRQDKEMLVFPLVSGICCMLVMATFVLPLWGLGIFDQLRAVGQENPQQIMQNPLVWVVTFLYYWVNYFVIIFFNSALVGCAIIRFRGENPTISDGFRAASNRLPQILGWSFLAATVGMLLNMIESRSQKLGAIAAAVLGAAWTIATYFVVPVIVIEKAGPIESLKRSTSIVRSTWGEAIGANFGIGVFTFLAILPGAALLFAGILLAAQFSAPLGFAVMGCGVICVILASLISTALNSIILAALYLYAAEGSVPSQFNQQIFNSAFRMK